MGVLLADTKALILCAAEEMEPVKTFECGQCFRLKADEKGGLLGRCHGPAGKAMGCGQIDLHTASCLSGILDGFFWPEPGLCPHQPPGEAKYCILDQEIGAQIFSNFLKILVDKSVGICYYN